MDTKELQKKTILIQAWEDWDDAPKSEVSPDQPKLCKIDNPDCEACQ